VNIEEKVTESNPHYQLGNLRRGMYAARAFKASDQMTRHLVAVTREQDQIAVTGEEGRVIRDAALGGPAQISGSGVMGSGIRCEECINRGDDIREIIGRSRADPDCHTATLCRREAAIPIYRLIVLLL